MTLNEYATKLGLSLNACQIQLLDLIEERKDENLIISFPRLSGRQLMYNLVERKKGYDEGYEQGKAEALNIDLDTPMHFTDEQKAWVKKYIAINGERQRLDGAREFAEYLCEKYSRIRQDSIGFEIFQNIYWKSIDEVLVEWQKEVNNERRS